MPYKSEAQRKYFNSPAGKAKIGKEEVEHWNEVSKGKELPEKAVDKALAICDGQVKQTVKIKQDRSMKSGTYRVETISGTVLKDGFKTTEAARKWIIKEGHKELK